MQENIDIKTSYEKTISETENAYMKVILDEISLIIDIGKFTDIIAGAKTRRHSVDEEN